MRHYKDTNNNLFGFEENQTVPEGLIEITVDECRQIAEQKAQLDFQNKLYSEKRIAEYPSIGDQLDALFHAGVFPAEMAAVIQAVKDKYPKG